MRAILTIGISSSGKSTWAGQFLAGHSGWIEINRDNVRFDSFCDGERNWSKYNWRNEKKVTEICNQQIKDAVDNKRNIIVSDTNLNPKHRNNLIEKLKLLSYNVEIKEFPIELSEAIKRDKLRPNSVGTEVIYRQWIQWQDYIGRKRYEITEFLPPAVIVDVDGTIAEKSNRSHFDWNKVGEDKPISEVMDIVDGLYDRGYNVVFLSGRDACCYQQTYDWLSSYFQFSVDLYMRPEGDCRKDAIIKEELFWEHVAPYYNVKMVIDDRMQVIEECWTPLGIKVINVGRIHERF